jgi:hypothetical protein
MNGYVRAQYGPGRHEFAGNTIRKAITNRYPDLGKSRYSNGIYYLHGVKLTQEGEEHGKIESARRDSTALWRGNLLSGDRRKPDVKAQESWEKELTERRDAKDRKPRF